MAGPDDSEDFAALLAEYEGKDTGRRKDPKVGEEVKGRIVSIGQEAAFVDLGAKSEGILSIDQIRDEEGKVLVSVGETIEARVVESGVGGIILRRAFGRGGRNAIAKGAEASAELQQAFELGIPVEGVVTGVNKGGVEVLVAGTRAFCPISQLDLRHVEDASAYVGQRLDFRITKLDTSRRELNLVLSRRALLEEESRKKAEATRDRLEVGAVLEGTITSVKDYGAFVDLGGIEGMLHVSEIGFTRVSKPSDVLSVGQPVQVQVLKIEKTGDAKRPEKISLSLKSLEKDPWADIGDRYPEGTKLAGTVARTESFGAFIELAPGVEGLLHVSELNAGKRLVHARQAIKVGQRVEVIVGKVDRERRRLSLSLARPAEEGDEADAGPLPQAEQKSFGTFADLLKGAGKNKEKKK